MHRDDASVRLIFEKKASTSMENKTDDINHKLGIGMFLEIVQCKMSGAGIVRYPQSLS